MKPDDRNVNDVFSVVHLEETAAVPDHQIVAPRHWVQVRWSTGNYPEE